LHRSKGEQVSRTRTHAIHEDEPFRPTLRCAVDDEVEALGRWLGLGVDAGR
jgi:hypothetical protein